MEKEWTLKIIDSVKTPLGFFTLTALIVDVLLMFASGGDTNFLKAAIILFVLVFASFAVVIFKNPLALYHPKDWPKQEKPLTINLIFNLSNEEVESLKFEKCILKIHDEKFGDKESNQIVTLGGLSKDGVQAWTLKLFDAKPESIASLEMVDNKGRKWEVSPFYLYAPYQITRKVVER